MTTKTSTKTSLIQLGVAISIALASVWVFRGVLGMDAMTSATRSTQESIAKINASTEALKAIGSSDSRYTLSQYEQLEAGMSVSQAESILGKGKEMSRVEMAGVPLTISYMWQNSDGSNMNAMFQDDKLISKAQALLK